MLKNFINSASAKTEVDTSSLSSWLDLDKIARVELTSEDPEHPFEEALRTDTSQGWKASTPGPQVLRLHFDEALRISRIHLRFREESVERSQEIALIATFDGGPARELVRQQWTFSPNGAMTEEETYFFDLKSVTSIELQIDPGRHNKQAYATLQTIQIG